MKIVVSNTTKGAYAGVLAALKDTLSKGGECVVITEDRMTATVERAILSSLTEGESGGMFNISVSSFTRLASKFLGDKIARCLTPEGSVMLLADVIEKRADELTYYGRAAKTEGFATEMYAALTALRNSGISSADLREKACGDPSSADKTPAALSPTRRKAADLALLYEGYLGALADGHSDSSTRLEALAAEIKSGEQIPTHFFVIDFLEFKAPEYAVLEGLAEKALSLTVGAVSGEGNPNARIYPDDTLGKLRRLTKDRPVENFAPEELDEVRSAVGKYLFSYDKPLKPVENKGKIKLLSALNRRDEVLSAVLDIVEKVRAGARYKDFEILIGADEYIPLLKSAFERYNVHFFIDRKEMLYEQTKVRYLVSALNVSKSNYKLEEVRAFIKNPLFIDVIDGDSYLEKENKVFVFENYVLEFGVNRGVFFKPFDFGDADRVSVAEEVRRKLLAVTKPFDFSGTRSSEELVAASREFLNGAESAWRAHVERLSELSSYYKKCAEQVDDKIKSVLDEIFAVLHGEYGVAEFERILKAMLHTLKIALVPTFLDCVFVGDLDSRFTGGKHFYILGANAGAFPAESGGGKVITSKDEEFFESVGLPVTPDERRKIKSGLFAVTEVIKKAKGSLTISYAQTSSGGVLRPSTVLAQLGSIVCEKGVPLTAEEISFDNLFRKSEEEKNRLVKALLSTKKACFYEVLEGAVSGNAAPEDIDVYRAAYSALDEGDKKRIGRVYDVPERISAEPCSCMKTSVSRLETYFKCPYGYFLNYVLGLQPRDEGEIQNNENGTALHYVLEKFFAAYRDGRVTEANAAAIANKVFDSFVEETPKLQRMSEKQETARLVQRLRAESVRTCLELHKVALRSSFRPAWLEAKFDEDGELKPLTVELDGRKITLAGKIDRVDVHEGKFVVIDYKSFKSADLAMNEIYYGTKLQLYIYAQTLVENLELRPAGIFYMPVFPSFLKEGEERYRFRGQMTDDFAVMQQMDSNATLLDNASSLPVSCDRRNLKLSQKVHLTDEQFAAVGEYAKALAVEGAKEIADGYIKPVPLEDGCDSCYFADVCPHLGKLSRRKAEVSVATFTHEGEEEEGGEGNE